jgi:type II secretory pathway pseudopilin PulG
MIGRRGFTLLELMLALGLTVVVVGLVSIAVSTQLQLAATGRAQVQEAQLARALLHRIADDLHNAVPYSANPLPGTGLSGTSNQLQLDVCRPALPSPSLAAAAQMDASIGGRAMDVRTVCYYLAEPGEVVGNEEDAPGGSTTSGGTSASAGAGGLVRSEISRALASWAMQQGASDASQLGPVTSVPEVTNINFTYYDSNNNENDQWDSSSQQGLPYAVRISMTIRRPSRKPVSLVEAPPEDQNEVGVYSLLVPLANIYSPQPASADTSPTSTSTAPASEPPTKESTGGTGGEPGRKGKEGEKGKGGKGKGEKGKGEKGKGEKGKGEKGKGEKGKGERGKGERGKGGKGGEGGKGKFGGKGGNFGGKGGNFGGKGGNFGGKGGNSGGKGGSGMNGSSPSGPSGSGGGSGKTAPPATPPPSSGSPAGTSPGTSGATS